MYTLFFRDGTPYTLHKFKNPLPDEVPFVIWKPPQDKECVYKCNKQDERIIAILLNKLPNGELGRVIERHNEDIEHTKLLLDSIFSKPDIDYGKYLRAFLKISNFQNIYLVTDRGIRQPSSILHSSVGAQRDGFILVDKAINVPYFRALTNIANKLKEDSDKTILSMYEEAISTGVLGEHYYIKIPDWWDKHAR